jgi:sugar phosphate isomerase/epimerase
MKVAISNIIWAKGRDEFEIFISELKKNDVFGVELSLNSIFPEPLNMIEEDFEWLDEVLKGVSVSAIHSLTYTRPDLSIFNSTKDELIKYIEFHIKVAKRIGTKNLVFGSAQSRDIGKLSKKEANEIFLDFLEKLNKPLSENEIILNIEPLPNTYCNYLNSFMEGVNLLENRELSNVFIQLDIKSILESGENIEEISKFSKYIKHVHVSNPNFAILDKEFLEEHSQIKEILKNYNGFISGEILNKSDDDYPLYLQNALESLKEFYG